MVLRALKVGQKVRVRWLMGDDQQRFAGIGVITSLAPHMDQVAVLLTEHAGTYHCPNTGKDVEFAPNIHTIITHFNSWHPHNGVEPLEGIN